MTSGLLMASLIAGVATQAALLLMPWDEDTPMVLGVSALAGVSGLVSPLLHVRAPDNFDVLLCCGFFSLMLAMARRDQLLPRIQDGALFLWTPLFVYAIVTSYGVHSAPTRLLTVLSLCVLVVVMAEKSVTPGFKLAVYVWFLLSLVAIAGLQFRVGDLGALIEGKTADLGVLRLFVDGMAMTYLGIYGSYLFMLLPIPGRSQSFSDRMKEWRDEAEAMKKHVADARTSPLTSLILLAAVTLVLLVNDAVGWLEPWAAINLLLVAVPNLWNVVQRSGGLSLRDDASRGT